MQSEQSFIRISAGLAIAALCWSLVAIITRASGTGAVLGLFSSGWTYALALILLASILFLSLLIWLVISVESFNKHVLATVIGISMGLRGVRWFFFLLLSAAPIWLFLGPFSEYFTIPIFRFVVYLMIGVSAAAFIQTHDRKPVASLALGILIPAFVFILFQKAQYITDFPFSLGWSEGNRLWDYSLYFGLSRYTIPGDPGLPTYLAPGRHALWGIPFLFPQAGIVALRIWDVVIWTIPYIVLGLVVAESAVIQERDRRWIWVLWTFVFLWQGPIYSPLLLSAAIVVWGFRKQDLRRRMITVLIAALYAGLSRWTWFVAPAIWGVMLTMLEQARLQKAAFRVRLRDPFIIALAGLTGAGLSQVVMSVLHPRPDPIYTTALSHELLFYRLFPSETNPTGILQGIGMAALPVILSLIWGAWKNRKYFDWMIVLVQAVGVVAFFTVGVAASLKVGGGNNLHNLDMFLVSLLLLLGIGYRFWHEQGSGPIALPLKLILIVVLVMPVWMNVRAGSLRPALDPIIAQAELDQLRTHVEAAAEEGEVLFMDQRQLLTFGEVDVPLVIEYELKDMMNKAMGSNSASFERFYADLENARFSLIVSDPLPIVYKGSDYSFGEENDLWVRYVSEPVMQYYEPVISLPQAGVWLLAPRGK